MKKPPHNPCLIRRIWICVFSWRQWRRARVLSAACVELWDMPSYGHPENVDAWNKMSVLATREWNKLFTMDD